MKKISNLILRWYQINKRDLPWRKNKDPYSIWLSEIILQQTRVKQGEPYYLEFLKKFPVVQDLASATEDEVLKLWQGLGYYSRARNLHKTSKIVSNEMNGTFPKRAFELKKLPGIGDYTAAAVASIAFSEKIPVIDGNVYRVLSRLFNIDIEIGSSFAKKFFTEKALALMSNNESGDFNQAVMEFGALQCVPVNPNCISCDLIDLCISYDQNNISNRPVVKKKKPVRKRFINYFLLHNGSQCYVNKRSENDIWRGLYDFPFLETSKLLAEDETPYSENISYTYDVNHLLTHQRLHLRFFLVKNTSLPILKDNFQIIDLKDLSNLPVPKPLEKFIAHIEPMISDL